MNVLCNNISGKLRLEAVEISMGGCHQHRVRVLCNNLHGWEVGDETDSSNGIEIKREDWRGKGRQMLSEGCNFYDERCCFEKQLIKLTISCLQYTLNIKCLNTSDLPSMFISRQYLIEMSSCSLFCGNYASWFCYILCFRMEGSIMVNLLPWCKKEMLELVGGLCATVWIWAWEMHLVLISFPLCSACAGTLSITYFVPTLYSFNFNEW